MPPASQAHWYTDTSAGDKTAAPGTMSDMTSSLDQMLIAGLKCEMLKINLGALTEHQLGQNLCHLLAIIVTLHFGETVNNLE